MEWTFGITDTEPKHGKKREPLWEDEELLASSSHTFEQVVQKICETALKKRWDAGDYGLRQHLWNIKIFADTAKAVASQKHDPGRHMERAFGRDSRSDSDADSSDNDDDEEETKYRGPIIIAPREDLGDYQEERDTEDYQLLAAEKNTLSSELLSKGNVIHFTYDFGTTTDLYLKMLKYGQRRSKTCRVILKRPTTHKKTSMIWRQCPPTTCPHTDKSMPIILFF
jgi:hypothetical protein